MPFSSFLSWPSEAVLCQLLRGFEEKALSLCFQHLELSSQTVAAVIVTEGVGREECRSGAYVALPSGQAMWGTEDPDPGLHETNTGRVTLSVIRTLGFQLAMCLFQDTAPLQDLSSLR